jgi:hypothetical protein
MKPNFLLFIETLMLYMGIENWIPFVLDGLGVTQFLYRVDMSYPLQNHIDDLMSQFDDLKALADLKIQNTDQPLSDSKLCWTMANLENLWIVLKLIRNFISK